MFSESRTKPDGTPLVLIVEDEPLLRTSIARGLAKRVEVIDVGTCADAKRLIGAERPSLVLADLQLPDGSGLDLIDTLEQAGLRVPVVFMTAFLGAFRERIPRGSNIEVLEKPVSLAKIRQIVVDLLCVRPESKPPFSLADFLQLAGMGQHSVVLRVERDGEPLGELVVQHGHLCYAADIVGAGESAVRRLLFDYDQRRVRVRYETLEGPPPDSNVGQPWQAILLEAARTHDEDSKGLEKASPEVLAEPGPIQGHFDAFYEAGVDALLRKDYEEAFEAFLAASKIIAGDRRVIANLARLREMGFSSEFDA
jgi:CheY-like chemotaxis protein